MAGTINPFGKDIITLKTVFCGRELSIETGRTAFQTNSVIVRYGDTVVQGVATASQHETQLDYFPLSIEYEEKMYAAGKISGSRFIKREGRPSEEAIQTARLIDRPIRPLFPKAFKRELQGVASVLSLDPDLKPDTIAMFAISAAISLTGAPFEGPVAGVRIGLVDGKLVTFPTTDEVEASDLDLVVAGTESAVMMVEAGANEVSEDTLVEALELAHEAIQPLIQIQKDLVAKVKPVALEYDEIEEDEDIVKQVNDFLEGKLGENVRGKDKPFRDEKLHKLQEEMLEALIGDEEDKEEKTDHHPYIHAFHDAIKAELRRSIIEDGIRPDDRGPEDIRPLSSEVGFLPRAHGSSLFTRGSTQALNVTTLAPLSYAQMLDTMERDDIEKTFIHHYNMPGWTVGEVRRIGSPGRREIGHGALAERALKPVIPNVEDFPYVIRTVSELQSSNGSTSMASVCSGCLSLMDAGVPIKKPVSGIAMGLMTDGDTEVILSDIQGAEDFAGDMDFKVAGTADGVTALQMDIKVHGLSTETLKKALEQAKQGRAHILESMLKTIPGPRGQLSKFAPQIEKMMINPDKIRDVIGKGGETINKIIAETGAEIDIRDEGLVMISATDKASIDAAIKWVKDLTTEPEVGTVYEGTVVKVMEFGAFVQILPGTDGLVHISELDDKRVEKVEDVVKEGDKVTVKLVAIDDRGRLNLSMKAVKK